MRIPRHLDPTLAVPMPDGWHYNSYKDCLMDPKGNVYDPSDERHVPTHIYEASRNGVVKPS